AESISDLLNSGVYITNAVKTPKTEYAIEKGEMEKSLPWLEKELSLFPNVRVIMLMGDVAKKMFNQIAKKHTKKNAIPSGATYKIRQTPFYTGGIRVMPSYIITGGNILIEKSKCAMISEDLKTMSEIIRDN
ncbi:MAG: uracil-DNA glycosylase, partial [Clostridia bacterium]|nr:uracil-DNA glycosylase [Clostridia bacterium]